MREATREQIAEECGYQRIHCKLHGSSYSDTGICERCAENGELDELPEDEQ